jgi:hypothetical protein
VLASDLRGRKAKANDGVSCFHAARLRLGGYVGLLPLVAFNRCLALVGILKCSCLCSRCICCLSTCPWILLGRAVYHVPFYGSQRDWRLPVSPLEGAFGYDDFRSRWIMPLVLVYVQSSGNQWLGFLSGITRISTGYVAKDEGFADRYRSSLLYSISASIWSLRGDQLLTSG